MKKYRCISCGYIYNEEINFNDLDNNYRCPKCSSKKELFEIADEFTNKEIKEVIDSKNSPYKQVVIDKSNPSIERVEGCINCGMCTKTCLEREKMTEDPKCLVCVGCGQCILTCPKKVLQPKNEIYRFLNAKKEGKKCIALIAPASRTSIGDAFGYEPGTYLETKLVGLLRYLGFDYVYDVSYGADFTIIEEATELVERLKTKENLPMITSCCPAWVRYCQIFYPELLNNLSTCKSPISMHAAIVRNHFNDIEKDKDIIDDNIYIVAITPCTAKKWEILKPDLSDTNLVLTVSELTDYLKNKNIDLKKIKDSKFDSLFSKSSGGGLIFGNTGGVMESALRTTSYYLTGKPLKKIEFKEVRGYNQIKEATIKLGDITINVAAVDEMSNARPILDDIKQGKSKYDFIEIMNCRGGCIGGGGQPRYLLPKEEEIKQKRISSLYENELLRDYRSSYENSSIKEIYDKYLEKPGSKKSIKLLHTKYKDLSNLKK